jgi:hypothetical protein
MNLSDDGSEATLAGWGEGLKEGDFMLLKNGPDATRYKIVTIKYMRDPEDMWAAEVIFAPRNML